MAYEQSRWRLIKHPAAAGAWNMAVDEAILESVNAGESLPTLRLYAWDPACLSLGHAQNFSEVDFDTLYQKGWHVVRRPTGGRAILHIDELTYAVIAPETEQRVRGGVLESYLRLSAALMDALKRLGLSPQANEKSPQKSTGQPNPVCFETPSNYEITVNGKKLIGSAQARRGKGFLQHGTLPLQGDLTRIISTLTFEDPIDKENAKKRLLERATTVQSELGSTLTWDEASAAFQQAFSEVLKISFTPGELTAEEENRVRRLVAEKYGHDSWTKRI